MIDIRQIKQGKDLVSDVASLKSIRTIKENVVVLNNQEIFTLSYSPIEGFKVEMFVNGVRYLEGEAFTRVDKAITWTFRADADPSGFDLITSDKVSFKYETTEEEVLTDPEEPVGGVLPEGSLEGTENEIILGDYTFLGEVEGENLFGYEQVGGSQISAKNGIPLNIVSATGFNPGGQDLHLDTAYLKFRKDIGENAGQILFVAQKAVRSHISWNMINGGNFNQYGQPGYSGTTVGKENSAVYGDMVKPINGNTYKIRLLTGANANPVSGSETERHDNSEWDHLIVALADKGIVNGIDYGTVTGYNPYFESGNFGIGHSCWTQEQEQGKEDNRIFRGLYGVGYFLDNPSDFGDNAYGWRPALEWVPTP